MKPIECSCLLLAAATLTGALMLGGLSASAHAASPARPAGPSKEALAACEGKKEGDMVQLETAPGKTAKAVCRKQAGKLVAMRTASIGP